MISDEKPTVTLEETLRPVPWFSGGFSVQPNGTKLVLRSDEPNGRLRYVHTVWDYETRQVICAIREDGQYLPAGALSPDGTMMAYGYGTLTVVSLPSGEVYRRWYQDDEDRMARPAFHPDGRRIVSTSGPRVHVWDLRAPAHPEVQPEGEFTGHIEVDAEGLIWCSDRLACLTLSPDGRYALSGDRRGGAIVWDVDSCRVVRRFPRALDRQYLPARGPITFGLFDAPVTPSDEPEPHLGKPGVDIQAVAFFPDASKAVVAEYEYGGVSVYDIATGRRLARYEVGDQMTRASSLAVSPDGKYIVLGLLRAPVVWDWQRNRIVAELVGHREADPNRLKPPEAMPYGGCISVAFTGEGDRIITGGVDGTIRIWRVGE